ncbi:PepSY domain-containing protein [Bremerella cremea]|uniref:PepSY domain-containing protein n=1 Tax=Bremerella cremea TaxID=1031537 RepID=UPI0031E51E98
MLIAAGFSGKLARSNSLLPQIVESLEQQGFGPFSEIDRDDELWDIEVQQNGVSYEVYVDPRTGKIVSKHQDDFDELPSCESKPLSTILQLVLQAGYSNIQEVSFDAPVWEIKVYQEDGKHEVRIDPHSGKVISDRRDN